MRTDGKRELVEIVDQGGGRFVVRGPLGFETVNSAFEQSKKLFREHDVLYVDLSEVTESDSAGLALLLEWVNWARHFVREIRYENIPERIQAIAHVSEVSDLLAAGERWTGPLDS